MEAKLKIPLGKKRLDSKPSSIYDVPAAHQRSSNVFSPKGSISFTVDCRTQLFLKLEISLFYFLYVEYSVSVVMQTSGLSSQKEQFITQPPHQQEHGQIEHKMCDDNHVHSVSLVLVT